METSGPAPSIVRLRWLQDTGVRLLVRVNHSLDGKGVLDASACFETECMQPLAPVAEERLDRVGKRGGSLRRNYPPRFAHHVCGVSDIGDHTRNAARHRLTDSARERL